VLKKGNGSKVVDENGKAYLDLQSGYWCNVLGYGNSQFIEPVVEQMRTLNNVMSAFQTDEINGAMKELGKLLPRQLDRVAFLNSGSEAVDLALKIARAATGRDGVVVNERGYYGATAYTMSISISGTGVDYLPDPGVVYKVPAPLCNHCSFANRDSCKEFKCLDLLNNLVEDGNEEVAAIIYEPILGGGVLVPPIGYGAKLREYADGLGALLIANEVTTGAGKTGRIFAHMYDDVTPDIMTLGKAIGGGFPVSVVVTTGEVEDMCDDKVYHVQSHQNDALSGRVVQTLLSVIRENDFVRVAEEKGVYWMGKLEEMKRELPIIVDVRGRGLMFGVEIDENYASVGADIQNALIDKGYLMDFHTSTNTFRFFPPYVITYEEINEFNKVFRMTISSYYDGG
jgi:4-aminobutyrate aminotransferase-like enzyme